MALGAGGDVHELAEEAAADAPHLAGAVAGVAASERRAGLAAGAGAAGTALDALDVDLAVDAEGGFFEGDLDVDAAVGATLGLAGAATGGCAAEERVEDVAEAAEVRAVEAAAEVEALRPAWP